MNSQYGNEMIELTEIVSPRLHDAQI
jgi:hypothetical protein